MNPVVQQMAVEVERRLVPGEAERGWRVTEAAVLRRNERRSIPVAPEVSMLVSRTDILAQELRRQDLLSRALHEQAMLVHRSPDSERSVVLGRGRQVVGAALARLASLLGTIVQDSRDPLRTKEQDLAGWGVTWTQDPAQDEALALELQEAHAQRLARQSMPVVPSPAPVAVGTSLRTTIGAVLIRAGERLEGLPHPMPAK